MSEKKYIDVDVLKSELKALTEQERLEYIGVYDCINSIPAADVEEVRHGKWIDIPFGCSPSEHGSYDGRTKCSVCGFVMSRLYYKYCPCCGARMDGEINEI